VKLVFVFISSLKRLVGLVPTLFYGFGKIFLRLAKDEYDFKLSALSAESLIIIPQSQ